MLKAAFPNAKRFAFTGTPIPKTQKEFGTVKAGKVEAYLDRYSIDDAIKDGATVPVRYAFGPTELFLTRLKVIVHNQSSFYWYTKRVKTRSKSAADFSEGFSGPPLGMEEHKRHQH